jgi:hypothetical protein
MRTPVFKLATICALVFLASGVSAQSSTVTATGVGAIIANDVGKARDDALRDAQRNAVEQAVGTFISSESMVENYVLLSDKIYSHSQGFVERYDLLSERKVDQYTYEITISATVKAGEIKSSLQAIGLLIEQKGKPRTMVIIAEENLGERWWGYITHDLNTAETTVMEIMSDMGFPFKDQQTAIRNLSKQTAMAIYDGDIAAAVAFAHDYGADVIIIGKAISKEADVSMALGGMISIQSDVTLRAVRADNADIIGVAQAHGRTVHIDARSGGVEAITQAATEATNTLVDKIIKTWQADITSGMLVTITARVPDFNALTDLKSAIQATVRNVSNVYQRSFSGGTAVIEVESAQDGNGIATELSNKGVHGYRVTITGVSANTIELKLTR